ncbi:NAD-dependent epimerase/dehydratase family protein [Thermomonospora catenispora]|uniref:NAD-dependent epimerase/dehydratase family protein n=1 Tax=Thermomonospora catenispora TaxID=2493090 RepID=UPI001121785E|nr:NAD-dependent epimerase/dehydratase family protein [Thermomonospora catenispora]TNY34968.1 NAD-dependent epimerase/dehydratase family protein [Thermomonospora catenispora]
MRVFVSGATGFAGSHTVAALLEAGHLPRLLVRDPAKAVRVLAALGVDAGRVELAAGDMLDEEAVGAALEGCRAAIHAAAAVGVARGAGDLMEINVTGTRNVVGGAVARGLDPVVHVSTVAVFVPPRGPVITADDPLGAPRNAYGRSKVAAERYVRGLQDRGAPITIVYPGGLLGPHQPVLDSLMAGLAAALRLVWPLPRGGVSVLDVRDLATALTRCLVPGRGPRRWMLGGRHLTWRRYADLCEETAGARVRRLPVPGPALLAAGAVLDAVKRIRPFDHPLTRDAAEIMIRLAPTDDRPALDALGIELRPIEETLVDALRWLVDAGHLDAERVPLVRSGR